MLWGGVADGGALELRQQQDGGVRLSGRFPYATETDLAVGRSERIEARAFAARIDAGEDIHFLAAHDFDKPLASRKAGTLELLDTDEALEFKASISAEMRNVSYVADFLTAHRAGLIRGLSPGFQVTPGGERIDQRGDGLLRSISAAALFEISAVTRPAYPSAQIEARNWNPAREAPDAGLTRALSRWRI